MKRLSADAFHIRIVKVISDKRVAEIFHMDSDLMGSACFQTKGNKAEPVFFFQNLIVSNGAFSVFKIYHTLNDGAGLSGEGRGDGAFFRRDMSPYKAEVFPVEGRVPGGFSGKHAGQNPGTDVMSGNQGKTGGVPVQTV